MEGVILKGIGGLYFVKANGYIYECKARGHFRNENITPLAGDRVLIRMNENSDCTIEEILDRKNSLIRPPVANIDYALIVSSTIQPIINFYNIDKLTVICEANNIKPIIIITKIDLYDKFDDISQSYLNTGYKILFINNEINNEDYSIIKSLASNNVCVITGNTGVGKSTLINNSFGLNLATSSISLKLGRGKHTTRETQLYPYDNGYIIDSPGFPNIDFKIYENITLDNLQLFFPEFNSYIGTCKFSNCTHICEKGCNILKAVNDGLISKSRHNSYVEMYNELKDQKQW